MTTTAEVLERIAAAEARQARIEAMLAESLEALRCFEAASKPRPSLVPAIRESIDALKEEVDEVGGAFPELPPRPSLRLVRSGADDG